MRTKPLQMMLLTISTTLAIACACSKGQGPGPQAVPAEGGPGGSTVVATIGSQTITLAELDADIASQLRELEDQRYQSRRAGLDQLINRRLVKEAAAKRGIDEQAFIKTEVDSKVPPVSDDQVKAFFEEQSNRLPPGAKLEEYRDRIATYLSRQTTAEKAKALFADLRQQSKVSVTLMPPPKPRVQVAATGPSRGPADAKVTIVEFSDFQCQFCKLGHQTIDEVVKKYDGKVRLVFRNFPLQTMHPNAHKAAQAALCAEDQGKFWPMHDGMFAQQSKLEVADLKALAGTLGMDAAKFAGCLDKEEKRKQVDKDLEDGEKAGVNATPAFFINGIMLAGADKAAAYEEIIERELAGPKS